MSIFTDSLEGLNLIKRECINQHPYANIVNEIRHWLMQNWTVTMDHSFRSYIPCTDWLAKEAHGMATDYLFLTEAPCSIRPFLAYDDSSTIPFSMSVEQP